MSSGGEIAGRAGGKGLIVPDTIGTNIINPIKIAVILLMLISIFICTLNFSCFSEAYFSLGTEHIEAGFMSFKKFSYL